MNFEVNRFFPAETRIPTILGLGVLLAGLAGGVLLVTTNQIFKTRANTSDTPQSIALANISGSQISIYWQTDQPTTGFVQAGPTTALGLTFRDERDSQSPEPHQLHFITLENLTPDTVYYYKVSSGANTYPPGEPFSFKTPTGKTSPSNSPPLIGTVLDSDSQPVTEAMVTLELPDAQSLAVVTKLAGNFILPLAEIRNRDLVESFTFPEAGLSGKLTVFNRTKRSDVIIELPFTATTLPQITLGQDLDLSSPPASPSTAATRYDLNADGVVNSLDLSTVIKNQGPLRQSASEASKNPKNERTDLNGDGVVDQKDIDIINRYIPNILPR